MTTLQEEDELFGASLSMDFYHSPSSSTPQHRPWLSQSSSAPPRQPFELLDDVPPATFNNKVTNNHRYPVDELYPAVDESGNGESARWYSDRNESDHYYNTNALSHNPVSSSTRAHTALVDMNSRYPIDDKLALHLNDENHYCHANIDHLNHADGRLGTITESRSYSDSDISDYQPMNRNDDDGGDDDDDEGIYSILDSVKQYNAWEEKSVAIGNNRFRYAYDDGFRVHHDVILKGDDDNMMSEESIRRINVSMSSFDCMYNDEVMELDIPRTKIELNDSEMKNKTNPPSICKKPSLADETTIDECAENHVDDLTTPMPLRTNQWTPCRPPGPCEITSTGLVTHTILSPPEIDTSAPNRTSFSKSPSCSSLSPGCVEAILVTPPQIHRTSSLGSDIFCIHGSDSGLSSLIGGNMSYVGVSNCASPISDRVSKRSTHSGPDVGDYSVMRAVNHQITQQNQQIKRREDPPDTGFGHHPQRSADAMEPEGYKQHGLFPDIELWNKFDRHIAPGSPDRKITHTEPNEEGWLRSMHDEEEGSSDSHNNFNSVPDVHSDNSCAKGNFKSRKSHQMNKHSETSIDKIFLDDEDSSSGDTDESAAEFGGNNDGISVISDESGIGMLAKQQYHQHQLDQHKRQQRQNQQHRSSKKSKMSYYHVKRKDSMESDINIDFTALNTANTGSKSENLLVCQYSNIKQSDSMEKELSNDFDEYVSQEEVDDDYDDDDDDGFLEERHFHPRSPHSELGPSHDKVASPPMIQRRPFSFRTGHGPISNYDDLSEYNDDNVVRFTDFEIIRSVIPDRSYSSVGDDDGKSENSTKPIIYPCKAMSQMNLRHSSEIDVSNNESDYLWKLACEHLARGRNNDALVVLTEMLQLVQRCAHDAKIKLKNFHFQKDREYDKGINVSHLKQVEVEDQLDAALQNSASAMANVLNNIGVVLEVKREYQLAMNSYQDALDMYRNTCCRYENAGDREVDRTVSNIMQLSIAMRYHDRRMELHNEADKLATQIELALHSDNHLCTELRMERLNVLMCVLDLETESLGQDHPDVGFTLLKKSALHLDMVHVDMAIKDTKDAVAILKKGLGSFHPEVGFALVKLGDMFNYDISKFGGGLSGGEDSKSMALSLYREALMPLRESFGTVNPHSGLANNCIGILYASHGEVGHAMPSFYDALSSYGVRRRAQNDMEAMNEQKSSHPDVFFVWINVGCLHMSKKEWQLALRSYLKALSAFRCLNDEEKRYLPLVASKRLLRNALALPKGRFETDDDIIWADVLLASLLQNISKAQSMLHRYGNAIDSLEEALQIHRVLALSKHDGIKQDLSPSQDMARILENLGDVLMISGDLTSAFTRYIESLNLLRSNAHAGHSSIEIALVLGGIGQVHLRKGEYAEARVVLKEAMRMFEKIGIPPKNRRMNEIRSCLVDSELALMQKSTSTLAGQRLEISSMKYVDKALAIDEIADSYKNKGDQTVAIWFYSESLAIRQQRVEQKLSSGQKQDSSEVVDVGRTISNVAQLRRDRREFGAAKILFDAAKQLYQSVSLSPDHPFFKDLTQEVDVMRKM